jgi:hypothetical protein
VDLWNALGCVWVEFQNGCGAISVGGGRGLMSLNEPNGFFLETNVRFSLLSFLSPAQEERAQPIVGS